VSPTAGKGGSAGKTPRLEKLGKETPAFVL
jgi:hypothetical protein